MTEPHSVAIRLTAPLQSWGISTRMDYRDTNPIPTKSGVIGLVANALGRDRNDSIDDLAALRFGVRIDRAGNATSDYHTVGGGTMTPLPRDLITDPRVANSKDPYTAFTYGVPKQIEYQNGVLSAKARQTVVTTRWYIEDANFVAALEGPAPLIASIAESLETPARALFLGRKSCPPCGQLLAGHAPGTIEQILAAVPTDPITDDCPNEPYPTEIEVFEYQPGALSRHDQPISFSNEHRQHTTRWAISGHIVPVTSPQNSAATS